MQYEDVPQEPSREEPSGGQPARPGREADGFFISPESLTEALLRLAGSAHHYLKIWMFLKQLGMKPGRPVLVPTVSPEGHAALDRLFGYAHEGGLFFVPFGETERFKTMKADAQRSIFQTNLKKWIDGAVTEVNPAELLDIRQTDHGIQVRTGRNYPEGLGQDVNGFAPKNGSRVSVPLASFATWYYRQERMADATLSGLRKRLAEDLSLSSAELELIFIDESDGWTPTLQDERLTDERLRSIVASQLDAPAPQTVRVVQQTRDIHLQRVRSMVTAATGPAWLGGTPEMLLADALHSGERAVLLYGPPRTGKTHAIDGLHRRDVPDRETIQVHDGWGYEDLMLSLRPSDESWGYHQGPLLSAIREGKKFIVLEEINRTGFSQAVGELFSLLESSYRGEANAITLRDGSRFYVPDDVVFLFTMNTLDNSTEDLDDALFGRMAAVEFPPRVEALHAMLQANAVPEGVGAACRELFAMIQPSYRLGHGYFAELRPGANPLTFYRLRIRPVLQKHLQNHRDDELRAIDEKADHLFG